MATFHNRERGEVEGSFPDVPYSHMSPSASYVTKENITDFLMTVPEYLCREAEGRHLDWSAVEGQTQNPRRRIYIFCAGLQFYHY